MQVQRRPCSLPSQKAQKARDGTFSLEAPVYEVYKELLAVGRDKSAITGKQFIKFDKLKSSNDTRLLMLMEEDN